MNRRQFTPSLLALCISLPAFADPSASEAALIDKLIALVGSSKEVTFIRNGEPGAPDAAAKHLKDKYDYFRKDIKTADDFIRLCGTRSESSKKPYEVRFADGRVTPAAQWLTSELKKLRAAA